MAAPTMTMTPAALDRLPQILASLSGGTFTSSSSATSSLDPGVISGALSVVRDYAVEKRPAVHKAWTGPVSGDPTQKDFWDVLNNVVSQVGPLIISAVTGQDSENKQYKPLSGLDAAKQVINDLPASVRNDKDFWTGLGGFLQNALPILVTAIQGGDSKSFQPNTDALQALPKDFNWGQLIQTGLQIAGPILLSLF